MTLDQEWTAFLVSLLGYAILLLPVTYAAARAWLQSRANARKIALLPTHDEVRTRIDAAVKAALLQNGPVEPSDKGE